MDNESNQKAGTRLKEKPKLRKIKHFGVAGSVGFTVGSCGILQQNPWTPAQPLRTPPMIPIRNLGHLGVS